MDAKTFLDNFTTIAEAPGGVEGLRDRVLDLAFRGHLTDAIPIEGKGADLLQAIATSRTEREARPKPEAKVGRADPPFDLPVHWTWARLSDIARYNDRPKVAPTSIPVDAWSLDLEDIEKSSSRLLCRALAGERPASSTRCAFAAGDVLYGKLRPYLDKVLVAETDGYCTTEIVPIVPEDGIQSEYLRWSLKRPDFRRTVDHLAYGMKMPRLGTRDALGSMHPVPPLGEQTRIVAKVDELMRLCEDLEAHQERRHRATTRFRGSALHALTEAQTVDEVHYAWERLSSHWPAITSHSDSIADLRETMVQLAVEGQLCLQDPTDVPAIDILQACRRRKASLVKAGIARSRSELEPASDRELPYQLPVGWTLARLDQWCDIAGGLAKGRKIVGRPITALPYLRVANVKAGYLALDEVKEIEVPVDEVDRYSLQPGDVLLTEGGDWDKLGRSAIWTGEIDPCLHQNHVFRARTLAEGLRPHWVSLFTNSETGRQYFQSKAKRTTNLASINMTELRSMPLPVPPAAEQLRILTSLTMFMDGLTRLQRALRGKDEAERLLAHGLTSASVEL